MGYCTQFGMFWVLSQNYQHFFEKNCPKNSKEGIEILVGQAIFKLWIKTVKIFFDQ